MSSADSRPPRQELMDAAAIAETFGVSRQTARAWMRRPEFPYVLDYLGGRGHVAPSPVFDGLEVRQWYAVHRPQPGRPRKSR